MPHPTPYSRQFDGIRQAFPGVFDHPGEELRQVETTGTTEPTTNVRNASIVDLYARRDGKMETE
jgi:hypothetical protein